jgi:hypothetical protein
LAEKRIFASNGVLEGTASLIVESDPRLIDMVCLNGKDAERLGFNSARK